MPPPNSIRDVLRIADLNVRKAWLRAYKKELDVLVKHNTFTVTTVKEDERIIPVMEDNRVKILQDGTLDKLKTRIVVTGDIQQKFMNEDSWSPTATHRCMKLFLAMATKHKKRVRILDFIGAFLQAPMRSRVVIRLPAIYGELFPEHKEYCGVPLMLNKSMYGQTISGRYWYDELTGWLTNEYKCYCSRSAPSLYIKTYNDGSKLFMLNYVDDMLYFGTTSTTEKQFEHDLKNKYAVDFKGQADWYLSVHITQHENFDITIDQNHYAQSVLKRFLNAAKVKESRKFYNTPLPCDFIATSDLQAKDEKESEKIQKEYNIDYRACIGCLLYLSYTHPDIIFAVNKLAKYGIKPGEYHMKCAIHVLRYIRDHPNYGIKFYSNWKISPVHDIVLQNPDIKSESSLVVFSDSSWQDDIDSSRSTGCYFIFFQGGLIDFSSNLPAPIALSSAEAEYNEACLATMALAHIKMLLGDLVGEEIKEATPVLLDNRSAVDMGKSFKETKHSKHIQRRYHYVREGQINGHHILIWIPKELQLSDIGTKAVTKKDLQDRLKYVVVEA